MHDYEHAGTLRRLVRRTAAARTPARILARIQPPADRVVYRLTRRRATLSSAMAGLPIAMLTTTGARSGRSRTQPVLVLVEDERFVVIASSYGRPRNPAWYHNLCAHPRGSIELGGVARDVAAHELEGAERDRWFERAVELYPGFDHYRRWAAPREIPVIRLEPAG